MGVQAMPGPTSRVHPDDPFIDSSFLGQMFHAQTVTSMTRLQECIEKLSMAPDAEEKKAAKPAAKKGKGKEAADDGAQVAAVPASPEVRYKGQLQAMEKMGFTDKDACIQALHAADGNM